MRVSLVTAVFNQADYLGAAIESVLAQDHDDLEYLVIDDGSTDDSLAVAQRYASRHPGRLRVIHQANAGQASAQNLGWSQCSGAWLGYLSSDDTLLPGCVSRQLRVLREYPQAVLSYPDFELMDAAGQGLRRVQTEDFDARRMQVELVCQPGPGALFRREVFERLSGWRRDVRQVPDFEFWLRASTLGPFVRVAEPLARYRIHDASASFQVMSAQRAEEIVRVVQGVLPQLGLSERDAAHALARARSLAARNHAQSGRLGAALRCVGQALAQRPAELLQAALWRAVLGGALRRLRYRERAAAPSLRPVETSQRISE